MSGGFTPGLRRKETVVSGGPSFLASEHYMAKRVGATFDSTAVDADSDGNKVIDEGTFVTKSDETGKYVPYADAETTPISDDSGYTPEGYNLRDGDVIGGVLIHCSVLKARVHPSPVPDEIRTAVAGRIVFQ